MISSKFLDPKNNCAFHRIFGTESNKDILIHFLNDVPDLTDKAEIKDVSFLDSTQTSKATGESTVDLLYTDSTGAQFICKIHVARDSGVIKRTQYYAAKAYVSQDYRGYHDLKRVIIITIADLILFPNKVAYKSDHTTFNEVTHKNHLKGLNFTFIELPKFPKTKEDRLENVVEKWCYFFRYASESEEKDLDRVVGSDVIIKRAYEEG